MAVIEAVKEAIGMGHSGATDFSLTLVSPS